MWCKTCSLFHNLYWLFIGQGLRLSSWCTLNSLRPRQNGRHFADDTFKRIFLKENVRISIKISLKFVRKSPIDNIPALFQIMAWRQPGDTPLSEAMMISLLTHICVARPQWINNVQIVLLGLYPIHMLMNATIIASIKARDFYDTRHSYILFELPTPGSSTLMD